MHVHQHTRDVSVNFSSYVTGIIVRNTLVTYDRENDKIGFWKTNCSELWKGLHYPSPAAPPPLDLRSQNTSVGIPPTIAPGGLPPTMAPVGLPHADFPGRMSFKRIHSFYAVFSNSMSSSITFSGFLLEI